MQSCAKYSKNVSEKHFKPLSVYAYFYPCFFVAHLVSCSVSTKVRLAMMLLIKTLGLLKRFVCGFRNSGECE